MTLPRLWGMAGALWLGCLVARGGWTMLIMSTAVCGLVARRWPRSAVAATAMLLSVLLVGSAQAGLRATWREHAHLAELAFQRADVEVDGMAITDARAAGSGAWQLFALTRVDRTRVRERVLVRWNTSDPAITLGSRARLYGTVRALGRDGFDDYLRRLHVVAELRVADTEVLRDPVAVLRAAERVRARTGQAAAQALTPQRSAVLMGLTVGEPPPVAISETFAAAGLSHLLVVSGHHAALAFGMLLALCAALRLGFRTRRWVGLVGLGWFVVIVRPQPSVLRAVLVLSVAIVAQLAGRPSVGRYTLGVGVIVLLLVDPELSGQVGFQLSVAASMGLLWCAARWSRALPGPRRLRFMVSAALAAQLFVTPVLWWSVGSAPLLSVPANLVAMPLAGAAQMVGLTSALVAQASVAAGAAVARLATLPTAGLITTAQIFARSPAIAAPEVLPDALRRILPGRLPDQVTGLTLTALDVGQGDALLIEAPGPNRAIRMLVDAGPDPDQVAAMLQRLGVQALDLVVLTHADLDHSGGLAHVLRTIPVGALVMGPHPPLQEGGAAWAALQQAQRSGVAIMRVHAGDRLALGSATVQVLSPPADGFPDAAANAHSLVMMVSDGPARVLLTGDTEQVAQDWLLARPHLLRAQVLKLPHHGGRTNADGFVEAVGACIVVISVAADNSYGHPHPQVLAPLRHVAVLRTDRQGTIRLPIPNPGCVE